MFEMLVQRVFTRKNMTTLVLAASTALGGAVAASYSEIHVAFCQDAGK